MSDDAAKNRVFAERRFGRFEVSLDALKERPAESMNVFGGLLIYRAESILYRNAVIYEAACAEFDPTKEGDEPPIYTVVMHYKAGKFSHRTFERVKR